MLSSPLATWPQYASMTQWSKFVESEESRSKPRMADVVIPLTIVTVVSGALGVGAVVAGEPTVAGAVFGFGLGLVGLVGGARWNAAREQRQHTRRRRIMVEVPRCVVSEHGLYDDDLGLSTYEHLADIVHVDAERVSGRRRAVSGGRRRADVVVDLRPLDRRLAASGWSMIELTFDPLVRRTTFAKFMGLLEPVGIARPDARWVTFVRVPPDRHAEAAEVVAAARRHHRLGAS